MTHFLSFIGWLLTPPKSHTMKRLLIKAMDIYVAIVGKEPDYTVEITRIKDYAVKMIEQCKTYEQLEVVTDWVYLVLGKYPDKQTSNTMSVLRSHIASRRNTINWGKVNIDC